MVVDDFLVFYKTDTANNQVFVYRILHGKRNVGAIIKELETN